MKVKCTANYYDKQLKKTVNVGEEFEVADARATILANANVAVVIKSTPTTPEVVTKPAPKKKAPAKKKMEG